MEVHIYAPDMKGRKEIFEHYLEQVSAHKGNT